MTRPADKPSAELADPFTPEFLAGLRYYEDTPEWRAAVEAARAQIERERRPGASA